VAKAGHHRNGNFAVSRSIVRGEKIAAAMKLTLVMIKSLKTKIRSQEL
jgi:hypothetical protein